MITEKKKRLTKAERQAIRDEFIITRDIPEIKKIIEDIDRLIKSRFNDDTSRNRLIEAKNEFQQRLDELLKKYGLDN